MVVEGAAAPTVAVAPVTPGKGRVTALDVRASVAELRPLLRGFRLQNVYDVSLSKRSFLLKFHRSDDDKRHVVIEAGIRVHPTEWRLDHRMMPSPFVARLRRHLRSRRLETVTQIGADRAVDFVFGSGDRTLHLIIELYVRGNVVLADANHKILGVLRPHSNVEEGKIAVGHLYTLPRFDRTLCPFDGLVQLLKKLPERPSWEQTTKVERTNGEQPPSDRCKEDEAAPPSAALATVISNVVSSAPSALFVQLQPFMNPPEEAGRRIQISEGVATLVPFAHPALIRHALEVAARELANPVVATPEKYFAALPTDAQVRLAVAAALECLRVLRECSGCEDFMGGSESSAALPPRQTQGFAVLAASQAGTASATLEAANAANSSTIKTGPPSCVAGPAGAHVDVPAPLMTDFTPVLLTNHRALPENRIRRFDSFLNCLDAYFSQWGFHKQEVQEQKARLSKAEKIMTDQSRRREALLEEAAECGENAALIESNIPLVQEAIDLVRQALAVGVSWEVLWAHIKVEKRAGHPIARRIHSLDLEHRRVRLLLQVREADGEEFDFMDDEIDESLEEGAGSAVAVDISQSAQGNIKAYHQLRKSCVAKAEKTQEAMEKAVKLQQKRGIGGGEKVAVGKQPLLSAGVPRKLRKKLWFTKFNWFITSENFLVLGGRDAQQNDILYRRYFEKNDVYVHADMHGAPSCILKVPPGRKAVIVPPQSLIEAGTFSVCHSKAWPEKLAAAAWWVYNPQVSKTAPAGEYIVAGGFIIRGRKNYLPPARLFLGCGLLFQIDAVSAEAHRDERKEQLGGDDDETGGSMGEARVSLAERRFRQLGLRAPNFEEHAQLAAQLLEEDAEARAAAARKAAEHRLRVARRREQGTVANAGASAEKNSGASAKTVPASTASAALSALPRGKKNKVQRVLRKLKKDDALWDDGPATEERELRAALLGQKQIDGMPKSRKETETQPAVPRKEKKSSRGLRPGDRREAHGAAGPVREGTQGNSLGVTSADASNGGGQPVPTKGNSKSVEAGTGEIKKGGEEVTQNQEQLSIGGEAERIDGGSAGDTGSDGDDPDRSPAAEEGDRHTSDDDAANDKSSSPNLVPSGQSPRQLPRVGDGDLQLNTLTAHPVETDEILGVVPVCAPWETLQSYKYAVKLSPGNLKKGKLIQQIIATFNAKAKGPHGTAVEIEAIQTFLDVDELSHVLVGNAKMVTADMNK